jgi:uncharacterized repeat protein (TIGR01451 family)
MNGTCTQAQPVACNRNQDCGNNGPIGNPFCQGNGVYQNYAIYACQNPGQSNSRCTNSTEARLTNTCTGNQYCSNGNCVGGPGPQPTTLTASCYATPNPAAYNQPVTFISNVSGGSGNYTYSWSGACNATTSTCTTNYFTGNPYGSQTAALSVNDGTQTVSANCSVTFTQQQPTCTPHYSQRCAGSALYWYDSCGNQQELIQYCPTGCINNSCQYQPPYQGGQLTVIKTVKNLTQNSGWANSTQARPSDVLMFMITLQATGNQDVQNVSVRDMFPSNLSYRNQLVVAYSDGYNSNYQGDITSTVNLPVIRAGQTATITYQAQLAPAQAFSYGTSVLTNNVTVTSQNSQNNPASNATIYVTRTAVYGASSVSTGLTNNFLMDSFILPLGLSLLALWMWKSGALFGVEKWFDIIKKKGRAFKTEKELAHRIATIKRDELEEGLI